MLGKTHVTNTTVKKISIYAATQFSNSYQGDMDFCNAGRLITSKDILEPLRALPERFFNEV